MEPVKDSTPLAGAVLCCTGISIEERQRLATTATEMGARHEYDLTSNVTHLIVGDINTEKYRYVARERPDIKVVLPDFIEAVRQSWITGGDTDVEALEAKHRVPVFWNLVITLTGFRDEKLHKTMTAMIRDNGGTYDPSLNKGMGTHLIAAKPEGKKYEYSQLWDIKIVAQEWLSDCVERGMVLNEALYNPTLSPALRGKGAWNRQAPTVQTLKRRREADPDVETKQPAPKRQIKRIKSAMLASEVDQMFDSIRPAPLPVDQSLGRPTAPLGDAASLSENASLGTDLGLSESAQTGIFSGLKTHIYGFDAARQEKLCEFLEPNGAQIFEDAESLLALEVDASRFLLVPHNLQVDALPSHISNLPRITEWWVEACVMERKYLDPAVQPFSTPFPYLTIDGFDDITVHSTGFQGVNLLHLTKALRLLGAIYSEYLTPQVSVVITGSSLPNREKFAFARDHSIPVVSPSWLHDCIATGIMKEFDPYIAGKQPSAYRPKKDLFGHSLAGTDSNASVQPSEKDSNYKRPAPAPVVAKQSPPKKISIAHGPFREDSPDNASDCREESLPPASLLVQPLREQTATELNKKVVDKAAPESISLPPPAAMKPPPSPPKPSSSPPKSQTSSGYDPLKDRVAALLARKSASRPPSADSSDVPVSRRKFQKLGRADSATSLGRVDSFVDDQASASAFKALGDSAEAGPVEPETEKMKSIGICPSQKVIYDDSETMDDRTRLIAKLGGTVEVSDLRKMANSIGVVTDKAEVSVKRTTRRGKKLI